MWVTAFGSLIVLAAGACDGADPAEGGFFKGLSGMASSCYEQRIEEREQRAAEARARQEALEAELRQLEARSAEAETELERLKTQHAGLKRIIVRLRSQLAAEDVDLGETERERVKAAIVSNPEGGTEAERIEALRKAVSGARALVEELAKLSS